MRYICDFHIHSKYSRATSRNLDLIEIEKWAKIKGIDIIATADFTHPFWMAEIKQKLEEIGNGLLELKNSKNKLKFILSTEISNIYTKKDRLRKIHTIIIPPSIGDAEKISEKLGKIGKLSVDGRPIFGQDLKETAKLIWDASADTMLIPAHAWTPHFAIFGSNSGFDSIEECFEELTPQIFAIETGLSSDPEMNWRLSALDKISLISNSDAHSGQKFGREANVFEIPENEFSFQEIKRILKEKDNKRFLYTIEFYPQEGKYHFDGHRACGVVLDPKETLKLKGICPKCKRSLTVGVLHRVEKLADRDEPKKPQDSPGVKHIIPLPEILADLFGVTSFSQRVQAHYHKMITTLGNEFKILLDLPIEEINKNSGEKIADAIKKMREGKIDISPGYDGEYGKISIPEEKTKIDQQSLFQ